MPPPTADSEIVGTAPIPYGSQPMGDRRTNGGQAQTEKRGKQKQSAVLQQVREQIVRGKWQPGQRMPSRGEFELETGVSRVTVQKVFDRLVHEGFIEVQGRRETRVAQLPPHLTRYAIAFPYHPTDTENWSRFWSTLADVARGIKRPDGTPAFDVYYNLDGHTDVREYRDMLTAARHHQMAGMIFVGLTPRLRKTPLLLETTMPRVLISRNSTLTEDTRVSTVTADTANFFDKAVGHLASKGCKTVAVLMVGEEMIENALMPALARHGLTCPPYWLQLILAESRRTVGSLIHLMLRDPNHRPDGLIIADDHFTTPATAGLFAAGVRVPQDLQVVVHENFPSHGESPLPFTRLGFDARETLANCLRLIDDERKTGATSPVDIQVPAHFVGDLTR